MAHNKYSLTRYGLGSEGYEGSAHDIRMECIASLGGSFGAGANAVLQDATMQMLLSNRAMGSIGVPLSVELSANLHAAMQGNVAITLSFTAEEKLTSNSMAGANLQVSADCSEALSGQFDLGANLCIPIDAFVEMGAKVILGSNVYLVGNFAEILSAASSAIDIEEYIVNLSIDLAPGDELRIDSENYTVTLNGVNILHLQEGDWIRLGRGLLAIGVDSGTAGALSGSLICEERWL